MVFMDIEKPSTFIMVKKGIKSNHNNCCLITDLFPSYILIEFTIFWYESFDLEFLDSLRVLF